MQDVRTAYWRAISAERILPSLKQLDEWVKSALAQAQAVQDEKLSAPLVPLQYKLDLLNTQRYIQQLYRDLSIAKLQLAALINLPPGQEKDMVLMVPERESNTISLPPDMALLEDRALEARPELRMIDYRRRINSQEAKAAILEQQQVSLQQSLGCICRASELESVEPDPVSGQSKDDRGAR
jgi:outer membrane protein TolC